MLWTYWAILFIDFNKKFLGQVRKIETVEFSRNHFFQIFVFKFIAIHITNVNLATFFPLNELFAWKFLNRKISSGFVGLDKYSVGVHGLSWC